MPPVLQRRMVLLAALPSLLLLLPTAGIRGQESAPERDQTPVPPFPYAVEEVRIDGGVPLGCTLSVPPATDGDRVPAALLLSVSGPNDRDQTFLGHRSFLVLADHLTRRGFAVLRCDDRGVGSSGGDLLAASLDSLTADAHRALDHLATRREVDPDRLGIIGLSEGSVVGARVAAERDGLAFLILLGPAAAPGWEVIARRREAQAAGREGPEDPAFADFVRLVQHLGGTGLAEARSRDPAALDSLRTLVGDPAFEGDAMLPPDPEARLRLFLTPWYRMQITADGGAWLRRVARTPVLAIAGSLDRVNLPDQNLPAVYDALREAGNDDVTLALIPGVNHVMQDAHTGAMEEYGVLENTVSPLVLATMTHWLQVRTGR